MSNRRTARIGIYGVEKFKVLIELRMGANFSRAYNFATCVCLHKRSTGSSSGNVSCGSLSLCLDCKLRHMCIGLLPFCGIALLVLYFQASQCQYYHIQYMIIHL